MERLDGKAAEVPPQQVGTDNHDNIGRLPPAQLGRDDSNTRHAITRHEEVRALSEQVTTIKREVDALQIASAKENAPWYKQIAVLVSVAAFLLSLATTYYSERRNNSQELQARRDDLRQLIAQIAEVTVAVNQAVSAPGKDPSAALTSSSLNYTQKVILINQAAQLVDQISSDVTAAEYYAVASGLASISDPRAVTYYKRGIAKSGSDLGSQTSLRRGLALSYVAAGDMQRGRQSFDLANSVVRDWPNLNDNSRKSYEAYTEWMWSAAELTGSRDCAAARQHFDNARRMYSELSAVGWNVAVYESQLAVTKAQLEKLC